MLLLGKKGFHNKGCGKQFAMCCFLEKRVFTIKGRAKQSHPDGMHRTGAEQCWYLFQNRCFSFSNCLPSFDTHGKGLRDPSLIVSQPTLAICLCCLGHVAMHRMQEKTRDPVKALPSVAEQVPSNKQSNPCSAYNKRTGVH